MDLLSRFTPSSSLRISNWNSLKHWMRWKKARLELTVFSLRCRLVMASRGWRQRYSQFTTSRKPNRNVLATSYNQDLAKTFGRQTRDHAREPILSQAFPDFCMSEESKAVDDWRTILGGGYYATGMGGSTTGRAATLLLVDDPTKAREEAESATQRNKTWSYYVSALTTRKQPEPDGTKPIEIIILTRWHPDDLAGRIMETEDWKEGAWTHINFPAIRSVKSNVKKSVAELPEDDLASYRRVNSQKSRLPKGISTKKKPPPSGLAASLSKTSEKENA